MVKNYTVLRKRPEMTKEQFYDQWQHTLAPLFAKVPGLTKYTLYFRAHAAFARLSRGGRPDRRHRRDLVGVARSGSGRAENARISGRHGRGKNGCLAAMTISRIWFW